MLAELCESMSLIQLCAPGDGCTSQQLTALLAQEGALLQQLDKGGQRLRQQQALQQQQQHASTPREPGAISPSHDPLHLCRQLTAPTLEDVATITAKDLALLHREHVRGVGLQLQLLSYGSTTSEAASRAIEQELLGCVEGARHVMAGWKAACKPRLTRDRRAAVSMPDPLPLLPPKNPFPPPQRRHPNHHHRRHHTRPCHPRAGCCAS